MNREILRLAIPNILSNLSIPLLGLVDAALMGHLDHAEKFLSAVAIAAGIFSVLYWSFGFLRMGTTGMAAQAYGAGKDQESLMILFRGLTVAGIAGVILIACQVPIAWAGMEVMEGSDQAKEVAGDYFFIRIYGAPAALALYVFNGWFLGMQNAVIPLVLSLVINLVNIGANFLLVLGYGMEAEGIAWGTLMAQYSGLAAAIILFFFRYRHMLVLRKGARLLDPVQLKRFFLLNRDLFIRTTCLVFAFTYFTSRSGTFGDEILAANTLLFQLFYLMSYLVDGFAFAAESLVGKYVGVGKPEVLKRVIRKILLWGMGLGLLFCLLFLLAGEFFLTLLSNNQAVIEDAIVYLPWVILMPVWGAYSFLWDGIFIGATSSKALRNVMVLAVFAVFLPTWFLTKDLLGNHALWLAMSLLMVARGVGLALLSGRLTTSTR